MQVEGVPIMKNGLFPCFWRAPTDNDKGGGPSSYQAKWEAVCIDEIVFLTESCSIENKTDNVVKVAFVYLGIIKGEDGTLDELKKASALFKVDMLYTIHASGDIVIESNVKPSSGLPPLPRVGVEFHLEKSVDQVKWYGRGPFECYPDRKAAAHVGVYEQSVEGMHVPYIVPGESGGRADVRWVTFQNKDGRGIYASTYGKSPPMQLNASYFSTTELDRAVRNEELIKGDTIEVNFRVNNGFLFSLMCYVHAHLLLFTFMNLKLILAPVHPLTGLLILNMKVYNWAVVGIRPHKKGVKNHDHNENPDEVPEE